MHTLDRHLVERVRVVALEHVAQLAAVEGLVPVGLDDADDGVGLFALFRETVRGGLLDEAGQVLAYHGASVLDEFGRAGGGRDTYPLSRRFSLSG